MSGERGNWLLRLLDRHIGIPLTLPAALFRAISCISANRSSPKNPPKSIAILCLGAIGDALLISALIDGLRGAFPAAYIEIIGSGANGAALNLLPGVDSTVSYSIKRPDKFIAHLRARKADLLIDTSQWARIGNIICNLSGSAWTVGFKTKRQYRSLGYDATVNHSAHKHELDNFLALGGTIVPGLTGRPGLRLPPIHAPIRKQRRKKIAVCHMWPAGGYGRALKQWPEKSWAELIAGLRARNFKVFLTGSPANARETASFINRYASGRVFSLAGLLSLEKLACFLARADAAISVNTGIMHLAALAGAPTIGLHGATNPARWGPVGPGTRALLPKNGSCAYLNLGFEYPPGAKNSMGEISVEDVFEALRELNVL